jgi:hypothetical protein
MPMLFAPTIGAAIASHHWFLTQAGGFRDFRLIQLGCASR